MSNEMSRARRNDILLAVGAVAILVAFLLVLLLAPRVSTPAVGAGGVGDASMLTESPSPTASPLAESDAAQRTSPSPRAAVSPTVRPTDRTNASESGATAAAPSCDEVTPGPYPAKCITAVRRRVVQIGAVGAPVAVDGTIIVIRRAERGAGSKPNAVRVRLSGTAVIDGSSSGRLERGQYYLSFSGRRYRSLEGRGDITVRKPGRPSRFGVVFELPRGDAEAASRPGSWARFVWSPPAGKIEGTGPIGVTVVRLPAA
jgi:hypothetical protein